MAQPKTTGKPIPKTYSPLIVKVSQRRIKISIEIKYVICCESKFKPVPINKGTATAPAYIANKCCNQNGGFPIWCFRLLWCIQLFCFQDYASSSKNVTVPSLNEAIRAKETTFKPMSSNN